MSKNTNLLTKDNYLDKYLFFRDRQAGVSLVYSPEDNLYYYNAYCLETKIMKELVSCEYDFLDDAIDMINTDFFGWELGSYEKEESGCGNCAAK